MRNVVGIGGFFFRARQPDALATWYQDVFGIDPVPSSYGVKPWIQESGPTVLAPFPDDSNYFGNRDKSWMLNLRVRDLDKLVEELRRRNIAVSQPEAYPNGRFARLTDPEGNPIELWEPVESGKESAKGGAERAP